MKFKLDEKRSSAATMSLGILETGESMRLGLEDVVEGATGLMAAAAFDWDLVVGGMIGNRNT